MLKNILKLEGVHELNREQQQSIWASGECKCGGTGTITDQPSAGACWRFCDNDRKKLQKIS